MNSKFYPTVTAMSTIKNILTFGAYGRIEEAMKNYNKVKNQYDLKLRKMRSKSRELDSVLETVVQVKIEAIKVLNTCKDFSAGSIDGSPYKLNRFTLPESKRINQTLENGHLALTAATGAAIGGTAGVGSALAIWGLASTLGAASTGTAISTLSGAAATNATLALLGGGALSAGGGGMIAGTALLGGIVAIPALIGLGVLSHFSAKKKMAEIESAIHRMQRAMYKMDTNIIRFKEIRKKSKKLIRLTKKKTKSLTFELEVANRLVNGEMNKLTGFFHSIRMILFNKDVSTLANEISVLIDTPIFDENVRSNKKSNKRSLPYKWLAVLPIVSVFIIMAVPVSKETITNMADEIKHIIHPFYEKQNLNEDEINQINLEENPEHHVVTVIVTKDYGASEILTVDLRFTTGETMNEVLKSNKNELELVVKDNRIFSIKGVERNSKGSDMWMAQITDINGFPVDSIESDLNHGDVVELDLH
ncbi:hypothetical protein ACQCVE_04570 [Metabacillus sp. 113a]|uniref:hypothetical protein n=1 Tax=Metabacillus sp. 113a TaxID=3404706 RepID=UPI003CF27FD1